MRFSLVATALACIGTAHAAGAPPAATIFQGACATCHAAGSPRVVAGQKLLPETAAITGANPHHAIDLILYGHFPAPEKAGAWMPSFAAALDDAQIADVLNWLRHAAGQPPWPDLARRVRALRAQPPEAQP